MSLRSSLHTVAASIASKLSKFFIDLVRFLLSSSILLNNSLYRNLTMAVADQVDFPSCTWSVYFLRSRYGWSFVCRTFRFSKAQGSTSNRRSRSFRLFLSCRAEAMAEWKSLFSVYFAFHSAMPTFFHHSNSFSSLVIFLANCSLSAVTLALKLSAYFCAFSELVATSLACFLMTSGYLFKAQYKK